MRKKNRWNNCY